MKTRLPIILTSFLLTACDPPIRTEDESSSTPQSSATPLVEEAPIATEATDVQTVVRRPHLYHAGLWKVNEARAWWGTWTRKGNSFDFEITNRNSDNGYVERHTAKVSFNGKYVTAERSDGVHYKGTLSSDGTKIEGMVWNDSGGKGNWYVEIHPEVTPHEITVIPPAPEAAPFPQIEVKPGQYFLIAPFSITTPSGVVGVVPGSSVEEIHEAAKGATTRYVRYQDHEFAVPMSILTQNHLIAEEAKQEHQKVQAAHHARLRAEQQRRQLRREIARKAQDLDSTAVVIKGRVNQSTRDGITVKQAAIGGYVVKDVPIDYSRLTGAPVMRKRQVFQATRRTDLVFVHGVPPMVDGAEWEGVAYPVPAHSFVNLLGTTRTVEAFTVDRMQAAEIIFGNP